MPVTSMTSRIKSPVRWDPVEIGDLVELRRNRRVVFRGVVDDRTGDGSIVWVTAPVGGRRLFHVADGVDLAGVPA